MAGETLAAKAVTLKATFRTSSPISRP